jgi:hypothetical protein
METIANLNLSGPEIPPEVAIVTSALELKGRGPGDLSERLLTPF